MKRCILAFGILVLAATAALPASMGFLMISGGPDRANATFGADLGSVLILPFPDYMPGQLAIYKFAPTSGFRAFAGTSQVWFLGGRSFDTLGGPGFTVSDGSAWSGLYLSHQDPSGSVSTGDHEQMFGALDNMIAVWGGSGPFVLPNFGGDFTYRELFADASSLAFAVGGVTLGDDPGLLLSQVASAPSTEVDIFEHSPAGGFPIFLDLTVDSTGEITGIVARVAPEPGSLVLLGVGLVGLGLAIRRRRRAA